MAVVAAVLHAPGVGAAESDTPMFTFSGFGTFGIVQTDTDDAQFVRDLQPKGATTHARFDVDSNIGLQLSARPTKWVSATVQLLGMQRSHRTTSLEVEWAYVLLEPVSGLSLRGGRMALPMFAISDFRNVGYANTWVRPPDEVYGLALLHQLEGGELTYRKAIRGTSLSVSVLLGQSFISVPDGIQVEVKNVKGVNALWETDWLTVRAGQVTGEAAFATLPDRYTFSDFSLSTDRNNVVAQVEYVTRRSKVASDAVSADGWYMMGGYRFGKLLPYIIYSKTTSDNPSFPFHLTGEQSTVAMGLRWDAFRSVAFKFQLERADTHGTSGISFVTPGIPGPPGAPPVSLPVANPVVIGSIAVDFVF